MHFRQLDLPGAWLLTPERHEDDRGAFTRLFCQRELSAHGLSPVMAQSSLSSNRKAGTIRGLHLQAAPFQEGKLVRVVRGAIFDVVVDLRQSSPTYGRHVAAELSADNGHSLWVPPGARQWLSTKPRWRAAERRLHSDGRLRRPPVRRTHVRRYLRLEGDGNGMPNRAPNSCACRGRRRLTAGGEVRQRHFLAAY